MKSLEEMTIEDMNVEDYAIPVVEEAQEKMKLVLDENDTLPLMIKYFPWNEDFIGVVFSIQDVRFEEDKENEDRMLMHYQYRVYHNPNDLPIQMDDNEESLPTEENHMLDLFVGRVIESIVDQQARAAREEEEAEEQEG